MAKKKVRLDDNLDTFDDDLGLDDDLDKLFADLDLTESPPPKNKREAVLRSLKDGSKGIKEAFTDKNSLETAHKIATAAIPRRLSTEYNTVADIGTSVRDELVTAAKSLKAEGRQVIDRVNAILPENSAIKRALNKLNEKMGRDDSRPEITADKAALQAEHIASSISETLGQQAKTEQINNLIRDNIELSRHKTTTDLMSEMTSELKQTRKFQYEVANAYYRKSLELQYKHLFVSKEQSEVLKIGIDTLKNQLESIVINTSLPEVVKIRKTEKLKETLQTRISEDVSDFFYSRYNPLTSLKKNLVDKIKTSAKSFKDGLSGGGGGMSELLDTAKDMGGAGGVSKSRLLGTILAESLRDNAAFLGGEALSRTKAGSKGVFAIKDFLADPTARLSEMIKDTYKTDDLGKRSISNIIKGSALEGVTNLMGTQQQNKVVLDHQNLEDATIFDGRAHASIVKVIPGLLSKIYGEVKSIRTKSSTPEKNEVYFDHEHHTFTSKRGLIANAKAELSTRLSGNVMNHIKNFISLLNSNGLNIGIRGEQTIANSFLKYLMSYSSKVNPSSLLSKNFLSFVDPRYSRHYYSAMSRLLEEAKNDPAIMDDLIYILDSARKGIPNINKRIKDLHAAGLTDVVKELGIVNQNMLTKEFVYDEEGSRKLTLAALSDISASDYQKLKADESIKNKANPENAFLYRAKEGIKSATSKSKEFIDDEMSPLKQNFKSKAKKVKERLSKEVTIEDLRTQFFNSKEYADGKIKDFSEWLTASGYADNLSTMKASRKAEYDQAKKQTETIFKKAEEKIEETKEKIKETLKDERPVEELREEFFESKEYLSGKVKTFKEWLIAIGYEPGKESVRKNIGTAFSKARKMDKAAMGAIPGVFKSGLSGFSKILGGGKETLSFATKQANKLTQDILGIGDDNKVKQALAKTRGIDKAIMKAIPSALMSTFKLPFTLMGKSLELLVKDKDKDGKERRAGDWRGRLDDIGKDKELKNRKSLKTGMMDFLKNNKALTVSAGVLGIYGFMRTMNISIDDIKEFGSGLVSGVKSIASTTRNIYDAVAPIVSTLVNLGVKIGQGIGSVATGMMGVIEKIIPDWMKPKGFSKSTEIEYDEAGNPIPPSSYDKDSDASNMGKYAAYAAAGALAYKPVKGLVKLGVGAYKVAKGAAGLTMGAARGVRTVGKATAATASAVTKSPGKIMGVLNSMKGTINKKLGPKAGKVVAAKLSAKIAARAVPFAGMALLAYDAAVIAKDMISNGTDFKSAVSKQILGFDLYSDYSVAADDNGKLIKPDEEKFIKDKQVSDYDNMKSFEQNRVEQFKASAVYSNPVNNVTAGRPKVREGYRGPTDRNSILTLLDEVSAETGVNPDLLKTVAAIESGLDPNAKAETSTATGLFQFIKSTWNAVVGKHGSKYGIPKNANPLDPKYNALMGAEYIKDNAEKLASSNKKPNATDVYLAHFLGAGGARRFLSANPYTTAANMMPAAAKANRNIFYSSTGRPKTVGEIYDDFNNKMYTKAIAFGINPPVNGVVRNSTALADAAEQYEKRNAIAPSKTHTNVTSSTPSLATASRQPNAISTAKQTTSGAREELAESNKTLVNMTSILEKSLNTQVRMADTLDNILSVSIRNNEEFKNMLNTVGSIRNNTPTNNVTSLPDPVVNLRKRAY